MPAPQRIVVAIDNVDRLGAAEAARFLDDAHSLLHRRGFLTLVALDPARLAGTDAERRGLVERLVQLPVNLAVVPGARLAALLGEGGAAAPQPQRLSFRMALDQPLGGEEVALLSALAPLAGATPRALKAFGNAYRLARANFTGHRAALALMLAAERGCTAQERAALYEALHAEASQPLSVSDARLEPYVAAAQAAAKGALNVGEARVAQVAAAKFSYGA